MSGVAGPVTTGARQDAFAAAHARVLADSRIQFALPHFQPPQLPEWLRHLAHAIRVAWPVLRVLVWIGMAAIGVLILWLVFSHLLNLNLRWPWRRASDQTSEATPEDWRPDAAPARALLAEADALAAAGRFGEAARLVLLRSIEDIMRRRPGLVRPATTSRDLATTPALPAAARPAFAAIAGVVEQSLFADRGATAEAWTRARGAYAEFALAERWR